MAGRYTVVRCCAFLWVPFSALLAAGVEAGHIDGGSPGNISQTLGGKDVCEALQPYSETNIVLKASVLESLQQLNTLNPIGTGQMRDHAPQIDVPWTHVASGKIPEYYVTNEMPAASRRRRLLMAAKGDVFDPQFHNRNGDCLYATLAYVMMRRVPTNHEVRALRRQCAAWWSQSPAWLEHTARAEMKTSKEYLRSFIWNGWGGLPEISLVAARTNSRFLIVNGENETISDIGEGKIQAVLRFHDKHYTVATLTDGWSDMEVDQKLASIRKTRKWVWLHSFLGGMQSQGQNAMQPPSLPPLRRRRPAERLLEQITAETEQAQLPDDFEEGAPEREAPPIPQDAIEDLDILDADGNMIWTPDALSIPVQLPTRDYDEYAIFDNILGSQTPYCVVCGARADGEHRDAPGHRRKIEIVNNFSPERRAQHVNYLHWKACLVLRRQLDAVRRGGMARSQSRSRSRRCVTLRPNAWSQSSSSATPDCAQAEPRACQKQPAETAKYKCDWYYIAA